MPVNHIGGEADKSIHINFPPPDPYDTQYLDMCDSEGNVLDRVIRSNGKVSTEQDAFEDFEEGRLSENPIPPTLRIAATQKNTVFFSVASCYDVSGVYIDGDGMFSSTRLEHNDSAELAMGKVTLNAANPGGTYMLRLFNKKGIELDSIPLNWNGNELSPKEESDWWGAFTQAQSTMGRGEQGLSLLALNTAEAQAAATVFEAQAGLPSTNVDGNVQLRRIQKNELYTKSNFVIGHEEIPDLVNQRHPNLSAEERRVITGSQVRNLGFYEGAIGNILQAAVNTMYEIQYQAVPEDQALEKFSEIYANNGQGHYFRELADIGITLPSEQETLKEGQRLFEMETVIHTLQYRQNELRRLYAIDEQQASSPEWQIAHGRAHPEEVTIAQTTNSERRRLVRAIKRAEEAIAYANDPRVKLLLASREQIDQTFASHDKVDIVLDPEVVNVLAQREQEQMQDDEVVRSVSEELAMIGDLTGILTEATDDPEQESLVFGERLSAYIAQNGVRLTEAIRQAFESGAISTEMEAVALGEAESALKMSVLAKLGEKIGDFSNELKWKAFETAVDLGTVAVRGVINSYSAYDQLKQQYKGTVDAMANVVANAYEKAVALGAEKVDELLETAGLPPAFLTWCYVNNVDGYFDMVDKLGDVAVSWANARHGVDVGDQEGLKGYHEGIGKTIKIAPEDLPDNELDEFNNEIREKLFLHQEGSSDKAGKLVVIFLGQSQHLGKSTSGLYWNARAKAASEGYEVMTFYVGDVGNELLGNIIPDYAQHPDVLTEHIKNVIQDRIQQRGMFKEMPKVTEVSGTMYSWGGGVADKIFGSEESTNEVLGGIKPTALAYIDAINHPTIGGWGMPVERRPYSDYFYNAYQTNDHVDPNDFYPDLDDNEKPVLLYYPAPIPETSIVHGVHIEGADFERNWGYFETHTSIDEKETQEDNDSTNALDIIMMFSE